MHANLNMCRVVLSNINYPSLFDSLRISKNYARNFEFSTIEEQYSFRNHICEPTLTQKFAVISIFSSRNFFFENVPRNPNTKKSSFCKLGQAKDSSNLFRVPNQVLLKVIFEKVIS